MILTSMPDLPPRPLTAANAAFRDRFYARWGHENAIVCGRSCDAAYETHPQTLSIKTAWGGRERYFLREREVAVDDDHWLVLNEGRAYASQLKSARPTASFSLFFRPGLQHEVAAALVEPLTHALESPDAQQRPVQFGEHLREHGGPVSAHLRCLRDEVVAGECSDDWLEQRALLLVAALLAQEGVGGRSREPAARPALAELERRLRLAADFIDTCHAEPLTLADMARVACLSRYHFVRHFRQLHGLTPYAYLLRKRARVAERLLAVGGSDREAVAQQCGFGSRFALARALRRYGA
jgi:AraC-like DNA-binding protein